MIIFNNLYGRLGNNIIQLSNIIHIAIAYKHNIKFNIKKIKFFDIIVIEKYFNKYNNSKIITDKNNKSSFFFDKNLMPFPKDIFIQNIEETNQILQKAFLIKDINKVKENDLIIHIRSGDIFSSHPHPGYVPPPLSYYIQEIDKYNYETIYIICEDTKNPVVNELLKLYNNAVYEKNILEKDIRIILGATNILFSIGSFIPSLMMLSNNIKFIHTSFKSKYYNKIRQDYNKIMKPWKNTIEQRNYILTYDYN
jgi:hypothetical protein